MQRIVVVGNGIAGLTAADTLRAEGYAGEIVIVGDESHPPYSRPALSKAALTETGELTAHLLADPEHGATELLGRRAIDLDPDRRQLTLSDGEVLQYDGLVIAAGIRPRKIREDLDVEFTFRTLEDARTLRDQLVDAPNVIVIGAGVLGMELASSCLNAGCDVTVVSRRTPLIAFFGDYLATVFARAAERAGVRWAQPGAVDVRATDSGVDVILDDGSVLSGDLVITAIGDRPNVEWLESSGLLTDGELRVDNRGRVRPDIVAAGDIASIPTANGFERIPLWTSAIEQAKVAARALLRGDETAELNFQPFFWTEQFGLSLKVCGELPVQGEPEYREGSPGEEPALLRWQNADGSGTAVALNYRIPVPKLRALSIASPSVS